MIDHLRTTPLLYALGLALLCVSPAAAVNLAINYSDYASATYDALRLSETGLPQPSFDTSGLPFVSFATDASTGNLYGLGRSGDNDIVRVWDPDGVIVQENAIDYSAIGLGESASALNQLSPDIAVHNGVVAINYTDALGVTKSPLRMADADTATPAFSAFDEPGSNLGIGLVSLDFDETGTLYGLGQYAYSDFGMREDFIRTWSTSGSYGADTMFDYTSIGMSAAFTAGDQTSPDIAAHGGHIAINVNDIAGNPKDILHLNTSGTALAPYAAPVDSEGQASATFLDLDFDHSTGWLFGLGQYAYSTFERQEDFLGLWGGGGYPFAEVMFNYTSIGRDASDTAGSQPSPDLAVVPGSSTGDILAGDYNDDCFVDAADYTVWRDYLGTNVTLPGDLTPGSVDPEDYDVWRDNYGATRLTFVFPDGDFNGDGRVDAADYTVWRDSVGSGSSLPNDGGLGTPVGSAHYDLWRANYGDTVSLVPGCGSPAPVAGAAPEPSSIGLLVLLGATGCLRRRPR